MQDIWALIANPNTADDGLRLLQERCAHKPNNPKPFFDLANAYDMLGREEDAEKAYEMVRALGLEGLSSQEREHWFVQFGSTLRLRGKLEASRDIL